ncbi:putative membrane protein [Propionispora sp. 2/2-37]|uniref:RMD1 family protein n=1 Tax=Propionispora sp. 2/2-37 TaxID=1677858 RepID=UPI0006BB6A28|nr:RMD1 family protein [Propionispora sp. 2/2-37]CUH94022.1 putative membrane protein [Propionispora sp. 2/2-37]
MLSEFEAVILSKELNLNSIANHFGINRKFKWEDSLILGELYLQKIITNAQGKIVYLFSFGSAVFVNFSHSDIMTVVQYIKALEADINLADIFKFVDNYNLSMDSETPATITNDYIVVERAEQYHLEIISVVLAKSVALEKIESEIGLLLDKTEDVIDKLNQGQLTVSDQKLAKMSANALGFKLNTVSYIMLLDKPDITWTNEEAGKLFEELARLFELTERYNNIHHKTAVLMDITNVFAGLVQSNRGTRLEWAIIILIALEIVLSLYDLFWKTAA